MEQSKRNNFLLVSMIFGAVFLAGLMVFWAAVIGSIANIAASEIGFIAYIKDYLTYYYWQNKINNFILFLFILLLLTVIIPVSFVFNLLGWIKGSNGHILKAGISYILCLNFVSAPLCLTEYFDRKGKVQNKPFFYTWIYSAILYAICITLFVYISMEDKTVFALWIYLISASAIGVILHFFAWKTNKGLVKVLAGIVYVLGVYTVISGVICLISGRDFFKAIKNKLLFYAMVITLVFNGIFLAAMTAASWTDNKAFLIYMIAATTVGLILNFIAWRTNKGLVKVLAGFAYVLSMFAIISGVMCLISGRDFLKACINFLKAIKNKLLFYAMVVALVFIASSISLLIDMPDKTFWIYMISATTVGLILNFIAWRTNNKKVKIFAGIAYVLGLSSVISAILCFISLINNRKPVKAEEF